MTRTAGFDTVSEMTEAMVQDLVRGNFTLGGPPQRAPFEFQLPLPVAGGGTVHAIFTAINVKILSGDKLQIGLPFERASVILGAITACPLAGLLELVVPVGTLPIPKGRAPALLLGSATVTLDFDATSDVTIDAKLGAFASGFRTLAAQQLQTFVQGLGSRAVGQGFPVTTSGDGSLSPLVFTRMEVHTHDTNPGARTLAVYGNLLASSKAGGNATTRTGRVIASGRDIGFALAPTAFRELVFCPQIATKLGLKVSELPTTCGSGFPTVQGLQLVSLTDSFAEGFIGLQIHGGKSGFCYDLDAQVTGRILLSISNGSLVPTIDLDDPKIVVDIPWYCILLAAVVAGPIGLALATTADIAGGAIVSAFAGNLIDQALGGAGLPPIAAPSIVGVTLNSVQVHADGIALSGTATATQAPSAPTAGVVVDYGVNTSGTEVISTGITPEVFCVSKQYDYSEVAQSQRALVTVSPTLVGRPLTPAWQVENQALTGTSGTLKVPVTAHFALPLPGGSSAQVDAQVGYEITPGGLKLTNRPQDGNYSLEVEAACTECSGQKWKDWTSVAFTGNRVDAPGFFAELEECLEALYEKMKSYRIEDKHVPKWVIANYPPPERIVEIIRYMVTLPALESDAMVGGLVALHQAGISRSIGAPKITGVGKQLEARRVEG